jgi:hypothetical protein
VPGSHLAEPEKAPSPATHERTSPALSAFFDRVSEDRSHSILDLGPVSGASLALYSRFARWVRFADLSDVANTPGGWSQALSTLRHDPDHPFDLVLAWDVLDRVPPEERPKLVAHIAKLTSPEARLYLLAGAHENREVPSYRFSVVELDRMRYEPGASPRPSHPRMSPTEVERLVSPFRVMKAFTSQIGLREYVAKK